MVDGIGALGYNKSVGNEPRQEYQMNRIKTVRAVKYVANDDPYEPVRPGWYVVNTESGETVSGPFKTEGDANRSILR